MEKLYLDFINGDEIKMIKVILKSLNTFVLTAIAIAYLLLFYLNPQFMISITTLAVASLFIVHFIKKWSKTL